MFEDREALNIIWEFSKRFFTKCVEEYKKISKK